VISVRRDIFGKLFSTNAEQTNTNDSPRIARRPAFGRYDETQNNNNTNVIMLQIVRFSRSFRPSFRS